MFELKRCVGRGVSLSLFVGLGSCGIILEKSVVKDFGAETLLAFSTQDEIVTEDSVEVRFRVRDRRVDAVKVQVLAGSACDSYTENSSTLHAVAKSFVFSPHHGENIVCYKTHSSKTGETSEQVYSSEVFQADAQAVGSMVILNSSQNPGRRVGASLVASSDSKKMYLFGGMRDSAYLNDLWEFSADTASWRRLAPSGTGPSVRAYHQAAFHNGKLYVFGGTDGITRFYGSYHSSAFDDLWTFDPSVSTDGAWTQITLGTVYSHINRRRHSGHLFSLGGHLYLHAGSAGISSTCQYYRPRRFDPTVNDFVEVTLTVTGTVQCRYRAAGAVVGNSFYMMGGYDFSTFRNDVWVFTPSADGTSGTYRNLNPASPPPVRDRHMAFDAFGDFWIFGGHCYPNNQCNDVWRFDVQTETWHASSFSSGVARRQSAALVRLGERIYTLGGSFYESQFDVGALEYFSIGALKTSPLAPSFLQPPSYLSPLLARGDNYYFLNTQNGRVWVVDLPFAKQMRELSSFDLSLVKDHFILRDQDRVYFVQSLSTIRSWSPESSLQLISQLNAAPSGAFYFYDNLQIVDAKIYAPLLVDEISGLAENRLWVFDLSARTWSDSVLPVELEDTYSEVTRYVGNSLYFFKTLSTNSWSEVPQSRVLVLPNGTLGTKQEPLQGWASPYDANFYVPVDDSLYVFHRSSSQNQVWVWDADGSEERKSFTRSNELVQTLGSDDWNAGLGSAFHHKGSVYFFNSRIGTGGLIGLIRYRLR